MVLVSKLSTAARRLFLVRSFRSDRLSHTLLTRPVLDYVKRVSQESPW